ncbi:MAG: ABC transporter permease, partial [Halioglobus sp.]
LSGVSPLIAARYQIMVMCMLFASTGLSTALFLALIRRRNLALETSSLT